MEEKLQVAEQFSRVDFGVLLLYAVAAIAGAVGGCGAGAIMAVSSRSQIRIVQFIAYALIGLISGLLMLGFGHIAGVRVVDTAALVRWCALAGFGVPIALFSKNLAISAVLKRFGWEVQFTLRKSGQDRRHGRDRDGDD